MLTPEAVRDIAIRDSGNIAATDDNVKEAIRVVLPILEELAAGLGFLPRIGIKIAVSFLRELL